MRGGRRTALAAALLLGALLAGATTPAWAQGRGWRGITRQEVQIAMAGGWTAGGELTTPARGRGPFPAVVLYHGSGRNDRDQTLPDGLGSTFVPIAQELSRHGYAVLRFDKRGVLGVGPVLSDDPAFADPYGNVTEFLADAEDALSFAAGRPEVDPERVYVLGHSEGTQIASLLAADPAGVRPAGVITMGVVGLELHDVMEYQLAGGATEELHVEFDADGDGSLDLSEITDGFLGQPEEKVAGLTELLLAGGGVSPAVDANADGRLQIDTEVGALLREQAQVEAFPEVNPPDLRPYLRDLAPYDSVTEALPRYDGPSLILNGENDIQTVARGALRASAAVTAAGRDHQLILYPQLGHTMNATSGYDQVLGPPDRQVLTDIRHWLDEHSG